MITFRKDIKNNSRNRNNSRAQWLKQLPEKDGYSISIKTLWSPTSQRLLSRSWTLKNQRTSTDNRLNGYTGRKIQWRLQVAQPVQKNVVTEKIEKEIQRESKIPLKREPKTTTTVTETTSGEGWVQQVHQDLQQPHLSTVSVKKLDIEEGQDIHREVHSIIALLSL